MKSVVLPTLPTVMKTYSRRKFCASFWISGGKVAEKNGSGGCPPSRAYQISQQSAGAVFVYRACGRFIQHEIVTLGERNDSANDWLDRKASH